MDVVLVTLGIMGFGAITVSTYVFLVAARNYVSEDNRTSRENSSEPAPPHQLVARKLSDRRSGRPVTFPLAVNGILIASDRRTLADRRIMI
jgi:hypothetical protein